MQMQGSKEDKESQEGKEQKKGGPVLPLQTVTKHPYCGLTGLTCSTQSHRQSRTEPRCALVVESGELPGALFLGVL